MPSNTVTIALSKPIEAHGEKLSELIIREPTVAELRRYGAPYKGGQGSVQPDYGACAGLLSSICAIPGSSVDDMAAGDFNAAAMAIVGFTVGATGEEISPSAPRKR